MLLFIYGNDAYRIKQAQSRFIEKGGGSALCFDLSEQSGFGRLEENIKTIGLFSEKNTIAAKNCFGNKEVLALLKQYGVKDDKNRTVIITECRPKPLLEKQNKELFKYLISNAYTEEIRPLEMANLILWTQKQAQSLNLKINRQNALKLAKLLLGEEKSRAGKKMPEDITWHIYEELQKLAHFKYESKDKEITEEDITKLVIPKTAFDIFSLLDAAAKRDRGEAVRLLHKQLKGMSDPYYIHSMLAYQFRNLLRVKSALASNPKDVSNIGLPQFVLRKTYAQAAKFTLDELKSYFGLLHDIELNAKKGITEITDGLYNFIFLLNKNTQSPAQ